MATLFLTNIGLRLNLKRLNMTSGKSFGGSDRPRLITQNDTEAFYTFAPY